MTTTPTPRSLSDVQGEDNTQCKALLLALQREKIFSDALIESLPIPIFFKNNESRYIGMNQLFCEFIAVPREEVLNKNAYEVFPPDIADIYIGKDHELLANPAEIQVYETQFFRKDTQSYHQAIFYKNVFYNEANEIIGIIGSVLDLTKQKEALQALEEKKEEFETIFNISRDATAIIDHEARFLDCNQAYVNLTGFTKTELCHQPYFTLAEPAEHERIKSALQHVFTHGFLDNFEKTCIVSDNRRIHVNIAMALMPDKKRILLSTRDVTTAKNHEQHLQQAAYYDALTGLPNRRLNGELLASAISQAQKENTHFAVLYFDLDGFKAVNDTHGHEVGDQLLIELTGRLKQLLRKTDSLARLGGDEFIGILNNLSQPQDAMPIVERILTEACQPFAFNEIEAQVSASIGITFFSPEHESVKANQLIRQADLAMYEAKQNGKNRYVIFSDYHH